MAWDDITSSAARLRRNGLLFVSASFAELTIIFICTLLDGTRSTCPDEHANTLNTINIMKRKFSQWLAIMKYFMIRV